MLSLESIKTVASAMLSSADPDQIEGDDQPEVSLAVLENEGLREEVDGIDARSDSIVARGSCWPSSIEDARPGM